MPSSLGARVLLIVGFLAAFVGYDAWVVSHVVLDPNTTRAAAHALLSTPAVRRGLADELTKQIELQVPAAAHDPRLGPVVAEAVSDPRVATAFANTVANIHEAILSNDKGGAQSFSVNGQALTAAVHDALAPTEPQLAAQIEQLPPLAVNVNADNLPHLHNSRSAAAGIEVLAIMAALLLITASLLLDHSRHAFRRVGRRTAFLATTPIVVFVVLPRVLEHFSGDAPEIASALLRVYGNRVLPSAIALVITGLTIFVGAILWPRRHADTLQPAASGANPYTGPTPSTRRRGSTDPSITEKMYL